MTHWQSILKYEPLSPLLSAENDAITFFVTRDLLGKGEKNPEALWDLQEAQKIVKKQQKDGSWNYPGGNKLLRSSENYNQLETYRNLGYLVEMYAFNNKSPAITRAANFLFRFQTDDGDIRGILGNQYTPYYTAGMLELLIKAGYSNDDRIEKAFRWLADMRQNDGGWAIPLRTQNKTLEVIAMHTKTLEPDRSKPFSHLVTGMVLRAYAAHEAYRDSPVARKAGFLLLSSLFKKDTYPDRRSPDFWLKFTFPFWFTDLISAMDSLSILGFSKDEPQIKKAIQWFADNQQPNGLWKLQVLKNLQYDNDLLPSAMYRHIQNFSATCFARTRAFFFSIKLSARLSSLCLLACW